MQPPLHMTPNMTVRQVVSAWPACAEPLAAYPGARWGDRWSLQELAALARSCDIEEHAFVERLAKFAGVGVGQAKISARKASPMAIIFIALGIGLTLGAGWGVLLLLGIAMGRDYAIVSGASVHVHGVAQLWGWMVLFIFAVGTHLLRQNTTRPAPNWLERAAAGFIVAALLLFFAGLLDAIHHTFVAINVLASGLLMVATLLLSVSVIWSLSGAVKNQRRHGLIFLVGWLWVWAGTDFWLRVHDISAPVLPDSARNLLIILPVLGLGINAIYGFGIRLIPGLLNINQLKPRFFSASLLSHNAGLCLFLIPNPITQTIGAAMMFAGAILYLAGMNVLRSKPSRVIYGIDPRGHILIHVAFFWLVCGLAMILIQQFFPNLPHAYSGAWRHALTVGFITTMILGVGHRILPIFIKQPLASTNLMLVSAALIIVGNAGRVALELLTIGHWSWAFRWMGLTGVLELTALILFAWNLAMTVRNRRRVYRSDEPLSPSVRVSEAINARPELQLRLQQIGVTMFDQAPFIAPSMTFGALALACGRQPHALLQELQADSPS